jgi:hypothetical protein
VLISCCYIQIRKLVVMFSCYFHYDLSHTHTHTQDASEFDTQKTTNKEIKQASKFDLNTAPISLIPKFLTLHVFYIQKKTRKSLCNVYKSDL